MRIGALVCSGLAMVAAGIWPCGVTAQGHAPGEAEQSAMTRGLAKPEHRQAFEVAKPRPGYYWDRGVLVAQQGIDAGAFPSVFLYGQDGARVGQNKVWFKGATLVRLGGAAVSANGEIVASGYARTSDGTIAYFIARTDSRGNLGAVVRTSPFVPLHICAESDGTVWSFGRELDKDEAREDYAMLRHYSFETGLVGEFLSRHTFRSSMSPAAGVAGTPNGSHLRCTPHKIVLYVNRTNEYIEIDRSTRAVTRFSIEMPALGRMRVLGFAIANSGRVYGELSEHGTGGDPGWTGLFELRKDVLRGRAGWLPVPGTVNNLSHRVGPIGNKALRWAKSRFCNG